MQGNCLAKQIEGWTKIDSFVLIADQPIFLSV